MEIKITLLDRKDDHAILEAELRNRDRAPDIIEWRERLFVKRTVIMVDPEKEKIHALYVEASYDKLAFYPNEDGKFTN